MNVQHAPTAKTESHEPYSYTRLQGRWLLLARVGWVALVALTLGIFFASLPVYLALLQTVCAGTACTFFSQQLTTGQAGVLKGIGLPPGAYAEYMVALTLISVAISLVVSTVILWRRSDDRMALLVALMLVTLGPIIARSPLPASSSPWRVPNECLTFLALSLLVLVFSLFPDGRFVPRWLRWLVIGWILWGIVFIILRDLPFAYLLDRLVWVGLSACLIGAQFYRYRYVSRPIERQQTKWVVFGLAVAITINVSMTVPYLIFPMLSSPGSLYPLAYNLVGILVPLFIPLSFGFAMLRSRLWDIDIIINKALVYGLLTALLAVLYAGLVISLQFLLSGIIKQNNDVVIVISTLAIAALFQPLRHRIQRIIDRRFYRRKYDAAKTVEAFSNTLRNEIDLNQLREHLLGVVQETMQPAHISLWLRSSQSKTIPQGMSTRTPLEQ